MKTDEKYRNILTKRLQNHKRVHELNKFGVDTLLKNLPKRYRWINILMDRIQRDFMNPESLSYDELRDFGQHLEELGRLINSINRLLLR